jgi:hypothetical protein
MKRIILLLPILLLLAGCGRGYKLIGRVVVLEVPSSSITEIVGDAIPNLGQPIVGATVTLFHELDSTNRPVRDSVWSADVVTDKNGQFDLYDYATPGDKNLVGVEVTAPGYDTVFTTYVDFMDPDAQYFLVVLRKSV